VSERTNGTEMFDCLVVAIENARSAKNESDSPKCP
jgi:hypothetical protein